VKEAGDSRNHNANEQEYSNQPQRTPLNPSSNRLIDHQDFNNPLARAANYSIWKSMTPMPPSRAFADGVQIEHEPHFIYQHENNNTLGPAGMQEWHS